MPVWEQLSTDRFDPWQVVPRQVFTPYSRLLISTAFVVVSHVGCPGVTGEEPLSCVNMVTKVQHARSKRKLIAKCRPLSSLTTKTKTDNKTFVCKF